MDEELKYLDLNGLIHYHKKIGALLGGKVDNSTYNSFVNNDAITINNIGQYISGKASTVVLNDVITSIDENNSTKLTVHVDNETIKKRLSSNPALYELYAVDLWYEKDPSEYSHDANELLKKGVYLNVNLHCPTNDNYTVLVLPGFETSDGGFLFDVDSNIIQLAFTHGKNPTIYKRTIVSRTGELDDSYLDTTDPWVAVGSDLTQIVQNLQTRMDNLGINIDLSPTNDPGAGADRSLIYSLTNNLGNIQGTGGTLLLNAAIPENMNGGVAGLMTAKDAYTVRNAGDELTLKNDVFCHLEKLNKNANDESNTVYAKLKVNDYGHVTELYPKSILDIYNELRVFLNQDFILKNRAVTSIEWEKVNNQIVPVDVIYTGEVPDLGNIIVTYEDGLNEDTVKSYRDVELLPSGPINAGYYEIRGYYGGKETSIKQVTIRTAQMTTSDMRVVIGEPEQSSIQNGEEITVATVTVYGVDDEIITGKVTITGGDPSSLATNARSSTSVDAGNTATIKYTNNIDQTSPGTLGVGKLYGLFEPSNTNGNRQYPNLNITLPSLSITLEGKRVSSIRFTNTDTITYTYGNPPQNLGTIEVTYNNGTQDTITPTNNYYVGNTKFNSTTANANVSPGYSITAKYGGITTTNSKTVIINPVSTSISQASVGLDANGNVGYINITKSPNVAGTFEITTPNIDSRITCDQTTGQIKITNNTENSFTVQAGSIDVKFTPTSGNYSYSTGSFPESNDLVVNAQPVVSTNYFYFGTTQPTASNYTTLSPSYGTLGEVYGQQVSVNSGQTIYFLCPTGSITDTQRKNAMLDSGGNNVKFSQDIDTTTINGYSIYSKLIDNASVMTFNIH